MDIIGYVLLFVGGLLFYGIKIIYKKNEQKIRALDENNDDNDFLELLNKNMMAIRIIGAILVVISGILIIFL